MSNWAFLAVFFGGGLGSLCRYGIGLVVAPWAPRFPWATLLANLLAAATLGLVLALFEKQQISNDARLFWATGFCGGFSTFSTFTAETTTLAQNGFVMHAFANVLLNLLVCFLSYIIGSRYC